MTVFLIERILKATIQDLIETKIFLPWVFKIAFNLYRNFYKKNKKKLRELRFEDLQEQLHRSSEDSLVVTGKGWKPKRNSAVCG